MKYTTALSNCDSQIELIIIAVFRFHTLNNSPMKASEFPNGLGVFYYLKKSIRQIVFEFVHGGYESVSEILFPKALPRMFDGIDFRTVRRLMDNAEIFE